MEEQMSLGVLACDLLIMRLKFTLAVTKLMTERLIDSAFAPKSRIQVFTGQQRLNRQFS